MLNLSGLEVTKVGDRQGDYLLEANVMQAVPVCECADPQEMYRQMVPHMERMLVGYRLSTLANVAGKLPAA